ncbi:MAG: hypothetical protein AAFZ65_14415, partial [Planctomycetota bacterium]
MLRPLLAALQPRQWLPWLALLLGLPGVASAQALVNGGSVTGALVTSGGADTWTFSANAGDSYVLRAAAPNPSAIQPSMTVTAPGGEVVGSDVGTVVAAVSGVAASGGTYVVTLSDGASTPQTGAYTIYLVRVPGANEGGALPNGDSVQSSLEVGDLDSYTFQLNAGDSYLLRSSELAGATFFSTLNVYGPDGAL